MVNDGAPAINKRSFVCPYCRVYTTQFWYKVTDSIYSDRDKVKFEGINVSECYNCSKRMIWFHEEILIPKTYPVPHPSKYVPSEISEIYEEAATVLNDSVRASAALMRMALEMLLKHINNNEKQLNENIELLENKVSEETAKALHFIRLNGNDVMHAGVLKLTETRDEAEFLFHLFNMITEELITSKQRLHNLWERVDEKKRKEIEGRLTK